MERGSPRLQVLDLDRLDGELEYRPRCPASVSAALARTIATFQRAGPACQPPAYRTNNRGSRSYPWAVFGLYYHFIAEPLDVSDCHLEQQRVYHQLAAFESDQ
jgi:hypothetical protein